MGRSRGQIPALFMVSVEVDEKENIFSKQQVRDTNRVLIGAECSKPTAVCAVTSPLQGNGCTHSPCLQEEGHRPALTGDSEDNLDALDIKPVRRFIPDSVKNFFRGGSGGGSGGGRERRKQRRQAVGHAPPGEQRHLPGGAVLTPPLPLRPRLLPGPLRRVGGSYNSRKEREAMLLGLDPLESIDGRTVQTVLTYSERVEAYNERYAYMKSWAGLLRILGCIELLLGAAVFACVCAYIHKDNEWFNMYGYSQPQMYGATGSGHGRGRGGAYYTGPKTPFILVVAGLAWVVTVILLVMGMTMYYRTILLDSNWWPLTEFIINLALALLFMAAGIVYVRDTNRGGLCSYPVFNNGINGAFCRVEAGQTAAIIFLFVTMLVYLIGAIVCLKLWRHEAARRLREGMALEMKTTASSVPRSLLIGSSNGPVESVQAIPVQAPPSVVMPPEILSGHIPSGHIPKPVIMPDYVAKYPTIRTDEERDQYKAVFNDQYAEYKELHAEVQAMVKKFDEMDGLMRSLPTHPTSQMEQDRINFLMQEYQRKKMDPTFVEKRERCEYLKNKLSHIKQKIQEYNKVMDWNDGYSLDGLGTRSDRYD
ncbi:hypothetical protein ANANG_G00195220 [Anguilla anguilla]|uniref:MARVEL domain-containing protein 2 n=1 Tax=Anguilla anguilla TaxID=7936 RepID=A0A9D3M1T9_ANGAN|nr:hypothetical protein ANANG_G00195220 [Anguilla anguilla]